MVYDYVGKKRVVEQAWRVHVHPNSHPQLDTVSNLGLKFRNSKIPITQNHQTLKMISQDPKCKDEEVAKSSVERKVDGFLDAEIDRCFGVQ